MRYFLTTLFLISCGGTQPVASSEISVPFPLTTAQCPNLANTPELKAKLIIQSVDKPCDLTVTHTAQNQFLTTGLCPNVPVGAELVLTLRWYVISPTVMQEIVIAESTGSANLKTATQHTIQINFDDASAPLLKPKTKAAPTETAAEKDRFNCDRSGQFGPGDSPCDSKKPVTQTPGADKDNCSNLEELCKDTLFKATDDTDCN
jgi:hypothetical protein